MNRLYGNVINETEKLFGKRKTIFFFIVTALIPVVSALILSKFQNITGIGAFTSSNFMVTMLNLYSLIFIPLFVIMACADEFSGEVSDRTLKLTLLRPISRFKVYLSKNLSIGIYIAASMVIIFLSSTLAGVLIVKGNMDILQNVKLCIAALFPAFALALVGSFIAQVFKNASGAIITLIFIFIGLKILGVFIPQVAAVSLASYLNWHVLWLGNVGIQKLTSIFITILSYCIIFFAAGFWIFDIKDV